MQARHHSPAEDDGLRVLFISDDLPLAELYKQKLELDGYFFTMGGSLQDGLEAARLMPQDIVLLDARAAGRDVAACLRALRAADVTREVPVVILADSSLHRLARIPLTIGETVLDIGRHPGIHEGDGLQAATPTRATVSTRSTSFL